jgi:nucleoside-diphosphate-sugar epimerase
VKKRIAILGATSHIAKGLIFNFLNSDEYQISLFARNTGGTGEFLSQIGADRSPEIFHIDSFPNGEYDAIINCIGVGTPKNANTAGRQIIFITEQFDNLVLKYVESHQETLYINFSSGAAYGAQFAVPVTQGYKNCLDINNIKSSDLYGIAKIHSEAKHRAFGELNIVDLRVFSYFSRFVDLSAGYLITDMINSIINNRPFITNNNDIIRDYVIHSDLFRLVQRCLNQKKINTSFDVYSKAAVSKMALLDLFGKHFGLTCRITESYTYVNATGDKTNYYSENRDAEKIGYLPSLTSEEGLVLETKRILGM